MAACFSFVRAFSIFRNSRRRKRLNKRIRKSEIFFRTKSGVFTNALNVDCNISLPKRESDTFTESDSSFSDVETDQQGIYCNIVETKTDLKKTDDCSNETKNHDSDVAVNGPKAREEEINAEHQTVYKNFQGRVFVIFMGLLMNLL